MEEGMEIPIGADLSGLTEAFAKLSAEMRRLGDIMSKAMGASNEALARSVSSMKNLDTSVRTNTDTMQQNAAASASMGQKLMTAGRAAIATASIFGSVTASLGHVSSIMTALSSNNFGNMLANATRLGAGFKKAISSAFQALQQLGTSKGFWKVAGGVAAGVAGVLALRAAFRAVVGTVNLVKNTIAGMFRAVIAGARAAGNAVKNAFSGIASLPGKLLGGGGLFGKILPIGGLLSAAGAIALAFSQVKSGLETAGEFERYQVSLTALTGSMKEGGKVLQFMKDQWAATGISVSQQAATIQKFLALGFSPKDAQQLQKNILDVAGAVGMTADDANLLGSALAQVKAKGTVAMEELRGQIAEKGVPVFEALAAKIGVTQAKLMKLVADGKVPAQALIDVFMQMDGPFARLRGGAERLGATFSGMISRIRAAWSMMLAEFGAPIADSLKPIFAAGISGVNSLMTRAREMGQQVAGAVKILFTAFQKGELMAYLRSGLAVAFHGAIDIMIRGFRGAVGFLATTLPPIFSALFAKFTDARYWSGLTQFMRGVGQSIGAEIRAALPGANGADIDMKRQIAGLNMEAGGLQMNLAGKVDLGEVLTKALLDGAEGFKNAWANGPESDNLKASREDFRAFTERLRATGAELNKSIEKAAAPVSGKTSKYQLPDLGEKVTRAAAPAVMSLTRVGGGGFASTVMNSLIGEAKRQTGLLKQIAANTATPPAAPRAVYS